MVDGVRLNGTGPVRQVARVMEAVPLAPVAVASATATSTVATMAALAAPIDASRVAAIRAGIADGSYKVDADAIAAKMIEIDLPPA